MPKVTPFWEPRLLLSGKTDWYSWLVTVAGADVPYQKQEYASPHGRYPYSKFVCKGSQIIVWIVGDKDIFKEDFDAGDIPELTELDLQLEEDLGWFRKPALKGMCNSMSSLTFNEYSKAAESTAIYPGRDSQFVNLKAVNYCVLGLIGEAGELANKLKKIYRGDEDAYVTGMEGQELRDKMQDELGDVLWYLDRLALELGEDLASIAQRNIEKLASRKARGTLQGSGDNR